MQKFLIEIYPKKQSFPFTVKLRSNSNLTHLKASINLTENFKYYPNLKFDILQNIYKIMIKQKFLILRLDKNLFDKIDDFILSIQKSPSIKEIELEIAKGVDKIEHKSDEIIYHRMLTKNVLTKILTMMKETTVNLLKKMSYFLNTFIEFLEKKDEI